MYDLLSPAPALCMFQRKHRPLVVNAAPTRRAVEFAGGADDQAAIGISSVRAVSEAMQQCLRPAPACLGSQFVHRTEPVSPASFCCTKEAARGIANQASIQAGGVAAYHSKTVQHRFRLRCRGRHCDNSGQNKNGQRPNQSVNKFRAAHGGFLLKSFKALLGSFSESGSSPDERGEAGCENQSHWGGVENIVQGP